MLNAHDRGRESSYTDQFPGSGANVVFELEICYIQDALGTPKRRRTSTFYILSVGRPTLTHTRRKIIDTVVVKRNKKKSTTSDYYDDREKEKKKNIQKLISNRRARNTGGWRANKKCINRDHRHCPIPINAACRIRQKKKHEKKELPTKRSI